MSFVLDSSASLSWCFEDEQTPTSLALLDRVVEGGATVPALWPLEVLNALAVAQRRQRLDRERRLKLADFLRQLPIRVDFDGVASAWSETAALAERFGLTVYDAAYLELAVRLQLPLGSLDRALRDAATAADVILL